LLGMVRCFSCNSLFLHDHTDHSSIIPKTAPTFVVTIKLLTWDK